MKVKDISFFNGKKVAKIIENKLEPYDGSLFTGLKFTQLTDIGSPSANKVLITNANGDGIDYVNMNFNAYKEFDITNQNSTFVTWENNNCIVQHNMNGYILTQLFDNSGYGYPIIPIYIDENNIAFYMNQKPKDNQIYKLICVSCGYTLENTSLSKNLILGPCSNLGFYINETNIVLSWTDPEDIMVNEAILAEWDKTVLVRKEGSYPTNPTDGTVLVTTSRSLINKNYYRDHSFIDNTIDSNKTYYYMLFSQTTAGTWNNLIANKFTSGTGLSWQQVGEFVEAGRGPDLFPVGTTFIVDHAEYTTSTGIQGIAFRVVGHDQVPAADETLHHTMCLDMCEILFNAVYDAAELEYALTEDSITNAGKVYYTHDDSTYTELTEGTDYQVGDLIPAATYYEKNLVTNTNMYGNNSFSQSNLLQWANSDGNANSWFIPQTIWDLCGSLQTKNGFLKYLDKDFLSIVKDAKLINANPVSTGGGSYTINSKFWLLSISQVFNSNNNNVKENEKLSWFTDDDKRMKKLINGNNAAWWLRSISADTLNYGRIVNSLGIASYNYVSSSYGVSLACIIG